MATTDANILLDAGGKPIPQYWDGSAFVAMGKDVTISGFSTALPTGTNTIGTVNVPAAGVQGYATFTRPADATAYAVGDVVCASTSAGAAMQFAGLGAAGDKVCLYGSLLMIATSSPPTACAGYRCHLFKYAPVGINDNVAFNLQTTDLSTGAGYQGYIDITTPVDLGESCAAVDDNLNILSCLGVQSCMGS